MVFVFFVILCKSILLRYSFNPSSSIASSKIDPYIQLHSDSNCLQESSDTDHSGNDASEATDRLSVGGASELSSLGGGRGSGARRSARSSR
jgi:hypothetical protein